MITSASARRRSRSSRLPEPVAPGGRYRAAAKAVQVSPISPSNQPPASINRISGSLASILARSSALIRWVANTLMVLMKEFHLALRSRTTAALRLAHRRVWCALADPSFGLGEIPQDPDAGQSP